MKKISASLGLLKITGITGALFIMGLIIYTLISKFWGGFTIAVAVLIAIIYALLGIVGILKKLGL